MKTKIPGNIVQTNLEDNLKSKKKLKNIFVYMEDTNILAETVRAV